MLDQTLIESDDRHISRGEPPFPPERLNYEDPENQYQVWVYWTDDHMWYWTYQGDDLDEAIRNFDGFVRGVSTNSRDQKYVGLLDAISKVWIKGPANVRYE
jgi:hypothetical protein